MKTEKIRMKRPDMKDKELEKLVKNLRFHSQRMRYRQAEDRVRKNIEYGLGIQYKNEVNFSCRDHLLSEKRSPQR